MLKKTKGIKRKKDYIGKNKNKQVIGIQKFKRNGESKRKNDFGV